MRKMQRSKETNTFGNVITALLTKILLLILLSLGVSGKAFAAPQEITITQGKVAALPVAIPEFEATSSELRELAGKITGIVIADLRRSGLFRLIDREAYIQKDLSVNKAPRFKDWRLVNAKAVVSGRLSLTGGSQLQLEFRLWDVVLNKQLTGQRFAAAKHNWRRIGHIISDVIYERLTGEKGYFDTRIVYVDETGPKNKRIKRLAMMDQDGANVRLLTNGDNLVLTPRFSPTRQEITYMSYEGGKPRVFLLNIDNGKRRVLGDFPGMTFAPRFSPDGDKVIMSLSKDGATNLFLMDLRSGRNRQLTNSSSINTAPSFAPNGTKIVFESDREKGQQLYVMSLDGDQPKRISKGQGRYSTPVWSPRGDYIAFTKLLEGRFLIGVMRPDGTGERILTEGFHNEGPTWSPNGRVLMFFRESRGANGGPRLYSVDLTGYNERLVPTPSFGSDPAWGPLIN